MGTDLEQRTLAFALEVIRFSETLPTGTASRVILQQLVRSATAIGANYREANRAESKADFIHKVAIALKEAAESEYWLQICVAAPLGSPGVAEPLRRETDELIAILTTIKRNAAGS
jgi:four helix bundle protein